MFKKLLALLLALILALPAGALAEAAPEYSAAQVAEEAAEEPFEEEGALEEAQPEPLPEGDPEPLPEPDAQPEAPLEPDGEPDEAEAEIPPEASLTVRVEADELMMLRALVEGDLPAAPAYQWQAAERAALIEARQNGADEEPLWSDIEGARGDALDAQSAFGEAYAEYCYRCLVQAGASSAASEAYSFRAEEAESFEESESSEEAEEAAEAHPLFADEGAELRFEESKVKLGKGERYTPALAGLPEGAAGELRFASSKPGVFSVDESTGEIAGLKPGTGKLTARAGELSASVSVQVCAAPKSFRLEPAELELGVGELTAPEVVPSPKSAFGRVKAWRSGDEGVVAVEGGRLRAVAPGETEVTAVLYNDLESACKVAVREAPSAGGMSLALPEGSEGGVIGVGQVVQLAVRYENAAGSVQFRSENEAIATVDASGSVKGIAPGRARIVAEAYNGVEASLEIVVKAKPTKLALANAPKMLGVGEPWKLEVALSNKAGDDCGGGVTFRSSKPSVLEVDPHSGALTAKKPGSAKITATSYNKLKKSASITVKQAPTGFSLSAERLELGMGQTGAKLKVSYDGKKQFGNVRWENENPNVVSLSEKGALKPLAPGSSRITATVYNPASPEEPFVHHCDVTVKEKPVKGGVRLVFLDSEGAERATIGIGESVAASIVCTNGGGGGFTLSSAKKSVATASKDCVATGKKKGNVKFTAKTYNKIKASATMRVVPGPAQLRFTASPDSALPKGSRYKLRVILLDAEGNELELMTHSFESSDTDVVSVDPLTGMLTAISDSGSARITARAYNGVSAAIDVSATQAQPGEGTPEPGEGTPEPGEGTPEPGEGTPEPGEGTPEPGEGTPQPGEGTPEPGEGTPEPGEEAHPSITLSQSSLELKQGETAQLTATLTDLPGLGEEDVSWNSDDSSVATVEAGLVLGVGSGSTQITATVQGPSGPLTAECQVAVSAPEPVLRLSDEEVSLIEGRTWLLGATLENMPGVSQSSVSWSSDTRSVATVSSGKITAVAPGEAQITASVRYSGASYSATCRVAVTQATYAIQLDPASLNLCVYDEADISALLIDMPEATPKKLTWSTSKSSVASVQDGHVVAKSAGEAEITAKLTYYNRTVSAICSVTVQEAPPSLKLNPEEASLYVGDSLTIEAKPRSLNKPGSVSWESDEPEICQVDGGVIYALAPGSANVTASVTDTLEDGSEQIYTAVCKINIEKYPPEIWLNPTNIELREGESQVIEATLIALPSDAELRWSASSDCVSVEGGLVTALAQGEAEVTASATDEGGAAASATCRVSVLPGVSLQLSAEQLRLKPGEEATLVASFSGDASEIEPEVSWEIDDPAVASVSGGAVRANSAGSARITARAAHPFKPGEALEASCALTVTENPNAATRLESAQLKEDEGRVELRWELTGADSYGVYELVGEAEILRGVVTDGDVYLYGVGGGTHTYVVRPRNRVGLDWVEGEASAPMTVEVPAWRTPPEPEPAEDAGEGGVKLAWSEVPGAQGYVLYEVPEESGAPRRIMQLGGASAELAGVEPGWHSYSVAAIVPGAAPSAARIRAASGTLGNLSRPVGLFVEGSIVLDKQEIHTHYGDKVQLIPEVHMPAEGNPKVTWTSSNEDNATVDENGWVTPLNGDEFKDGGRATITASVAGGYYTAECEIYVKSVTQVIDDLEIIDGVVTDYTGDNPDVVVPYGVRRIGNDAFRGFGYSYGMLVSGILTSIELPSTVTSIGKYAFAYNAKLKSITLPSSLEVIEADAFVECSLLSSVSLPYGLKSIGAGAFYKCPLKSLQIPDTVTSIGSSAFSYTNLSSLTIPDSVTELGSGVLFHCGRLKSTTFPAQITEIPTYMYEECVCLESVDIPDHITKIGKGAFCYCTDLVNVTIPDSVTSIGEEAFWNCDSLTSISIPDSVVELGDGIFLSTPLQSIRLSENIKRIPNSMFESCRALESLTIPDSVTEIGIDAFKGCSKLHNLTLPKGLQTIYASAFTNCVNLESLEIPNGTTSIHRYAFDYCSATVIVPDSVAYIEGHAFNKNMTIICSAGSYAEQWAIDNNIPYSTDGSITPGGGSTIGEFTIGTGMTLDMSPMLGSVSDSQGYWTEDQKIAEFNGKGVLTGISAGTVQVADIMRRHTYTVHVVGFQVAKEQIPVLGTINRQPVDISGEWSSSNPQVAGVDQAATSPATRPARPPSPSPGTKISGPATPWRSSMARTKFSPTPVTCCSPPARARRFTSRPPAASFHPSPPT